MRREKKEKVKKGEKQEKKEEEREERRRGWGGGYILETFEGKKKHRKTSKYEKSKWKIVSKKEMKKDG